MTAGEEYTCTRCGGSFLKTVSDAKADDEYKRLFPEIRPEEPRNIVCDDCFNEFMAWLEKRGRR